MQREARLNWSIRIGRKCSRNKCSQSNVALITSRREAKHKGSAATQRYNRALQVLAALRYLRRFVLGLNFFARVERALL